ncbi:hypothetical protein FRAHR75_110111 [Frankia sp. Hr75.2]|nr:hypothetical protein FRAHR75_110111 [Frankia sp. Hr75.2]SQD98687.1 hypothetical protein FMEAI12_4850044 [Parafrankia sp. Ea1.12]
MVTLRLGQNDRGHVAGRSDPRAI